MSDLSKINNQKLVIGFWGDHSNEYGEYVVENIKNISD